jgi:transcription elongation factor Elf1
MTMGQQDEPKTCTECGKESVLESEQEANQEVTHCEWCGAEYPVPEDG